MHLSIVSLFVLLASLQIFLNVVEAQVSVESLSGAAQASSAYSQIGMQQQSPYYAPQLYPGYPSSGYLPSLNPYPIDESYYRAPQTLLGAACSCLRNFLWKLFKLPLSILGCISSALSNLIGLGSADLGYPLTSASASAF